MKAWPDKPGAVTWRWLGLAILLAFAGWCRWYQIGHWSLFADEVWSAMAARDRSWLEMFHYIVVAEGHPPGYHVVLRITQALLGISDIAVRFPSWVAGTLLVYAVYAYGARYLDRASGVLAAVLVCNSYYAIYYSQEARAYALLMLAVMVHVHALTGLLSGRYRTRTLLIMIGSAVAAAYLHYAGVVYVASGGLVVLVCWLPCRDKTLLKHALMVYGSIAIVYAPWLPGLFYHLLHGPVEAWQRPPTVDTLWRTWRLIAGENPERACLWAVLASMGLVLLWRNGQKRMALLLGVTALLPVVVFYTKSQFSMPVYNTRSFSPSIAIVAVMAAYAMACGLQQVRSLRIQQGLLALLLVLVSAVQWTGNLQHQLYTGHRFKQQYRQAVDLAFERQASNGFGLVIGSVFFNHYVEQHPPYQRTDLLFEQPNQIDALQQTLQQRGITQFYFLDMYAHGNPSSPLMQALEQHYQKRCQTDMVLVRVVGYSMAGERAPQPVPGC